MMTMYDDVDVGGMDRVSTAVKPSYEILTLHIVKTSLTKIKHLEWPNEKVEENGLAFFWPFWSSHILP